MPDGCGWSVPCPGYFTPWKRLSSLCVGGWVCLRGNLAPTGIQSPDCPSPSELLYRLPSSKCDTPYTTYGPRSHTKYEVLLSAKFLSQACESQRNSRRLYMHLHCQRFSFHCCLCMEFSDGKHFAASLEEIVARCNDC